MHARKARNIWTGPSALSRSLVKNIQRVNITVALVTLTVAIALLTPVLDVHSLAVRSQVNALAKGDTTADKFDFRYLKFKSCYGRKYLPGY